MANIQKNQIRLGIAAQSTAGTLAAAPAYVFGVGSGSGIATDPGQATDDLTSGERASSSVFRSDVSSSAQINGRAHKASTGLLLKAALGSCASTGAGDPYTHVFTLADSLPILTVFEEFGDGTIVGLGDAKVDELVFSWEGNKPLSIAAKLLGCEVEFPSSFTASVLDETDLTNYFIPVGGTFKIDVDGTGPAASSIKGGSVTFKNSLSADHYSGDIEAGNISEGWHVAECSFTTLPENLQTWRTIITGGTAGTSVATSPVYGSFEHTFVNGASHSLKLEGTRVAFMCELPTAEPQGGAAEVDLAGMCMLPTDNSAPVKVTLVNATASY